MVSEQQKLRQQQPAKAQAPADAPLDGPQSRLAPVELTTDSSCPRDVLDFLSIRSVPASSKASSTTNPHKFVARESCPVARSEIVIPAKAGIQEPSVLRLLYSVFFRPSSVFCHLPFVFFTVQGLLFRHLWRSFLLCHVFTWRLPLANLLAG